MFAQLPEEIFQLILAHITKNDMVRLARSCRPLYNRLVPELYTSINTTCFCIGVHKALVHTLLLHPELAHSTRHLQLGKIPWRADKSKYTAHQHDHYECPESTAKLHALVRTLSHRDWERTQWLEDLTNNTHRDPWLALLLPLLPALETLELFWGGTGTRYSEWVLTRGLARSPPFEHTPLLPTLHTTTIKVLEDEGPGFHLPRLTSFFQMPSMRTFSANLLTDRLREYHMLPPNSSAITTLDLRQCSADTGFVDLIAPCTHLRSFTYTALAPGGPGPYSELFFPPLNPGPVMRALATKRDSLQELNVAVSRRDCWRDGVYVNDWLGSLGGFSALRSLRIDASNFVGYGEFRRDGDVVPRIGLVGFLPVGLVALWVSDMECADGEDGPLWGVVVRELEGLVGVCEERFASLKSIDVEGVRLLRGGEEDVEVWREAYPDYLHLLIDSVVVQTESLRAACLDCGIGFRVRDERVEAYFEDVDDPFLFTRYDDDSDVEH